MTHAFLDALFATQSPSPELLASATREVLAGMSNCAGYADPMAASAPQRFAFTIAPKILGSAHENAPPSAAELIFTADRQEDDGESGWYGDQGADGVRALLVDATVRNLWAGVPFRLAASAAGVAEHPELLTDEVLCEPRIGRIAWASYDTDRDFLVGAVQLDGSARSRNFAALAERLRRASLLASATASGALRAAHLGLSPSLLIRTREPNQRRLVAVKALDVVATPAWSTFLTPMPNNSAKYAEITPTEGAKTSR